jgi:hypothetical protein
MIAPLHAAAPSLDALTADPEPARHTGASAALADLTRLGVDIRAARHRLANAVNRDDCLTGQERAVALWLADEMRKEAALLRAAANVRDPLCLDVEALDEAGIDASLVAQAHERGAILAERCSLPRAAE